MSIKDGNEPCALKKLVSLQGDFSVLRKKRGGSCDMGSGGRNGECRRGHSKKAQRAAQVSNHTTRIERRLYIFSFLPFAFCF